MVKITGTVANVKEPEEGKNYIITGVEALTTAVQSFNGFRVTMKSVNKKDEEQYATMLWKREVASSTSKLGAFMKAFADFFNPTEDATETDNWKGHEIKIVSWKMKNREIAIIK
jgi:hypothetical protein